MEREKRTVKLFANVNKELLILEKLRSTLDNVSFQATHRSHDLIHGGNRIKGGKRPAENGKINHKKDESILNILGDVTLTDNERRFLYAAECGNLKIVRQCIEENISFNVNCVDVLGRTALQIAVIQEHVDVVQYLLGKCKLEVIEDAFLHAIKNGFIRICELFLNHPVYSNAKQRIHLEIQHGVYDYEDSNSDFSPDITPIVLAAHINNFDIVFLLIQKGFFIPTPHNYYCTCTECRNQKAFDRVIHSRSRLNAFRGLASTAYMSLSSDDPIMTAFELSEQLTHLAEKEKEYKSEYRQLSEKCKLYAVDILELCRNEPEVMAALHGDKHDKDLNRIKLAIKYTQKKFIAHASCQERCMQLWYSNVPWFKHQSFKVKLLLSPLGICLMPLFALVYIIAPSSRLGEILRIPVVKFLNHSFSYVTFLLLLFIATTKSSIDEETESVKLKSAIGVLHGPYSTVYYLIVIFVAGMFWNECKQLYAEGYWNYFTDLWNIVDVLMISLYTAAYSVWVLTELKRQVYQYTGTNYTKEEQEDAQNFLFGKEALIRV